MAANWAGGVQLHVGDAVEAVAAFGWFVGPVALLGAPAAALAGKAAHSPASWLMSHAAVGLVAALLIAVAFGVESRWHLGVAAAIGAVSATVGSLGAPWASRGISRVSALGVLAVGLWLGAVAANA